MMATWISLSAGERIRSLKQTLYKNNGNGTFTDMTDAAGLGVLSNNRAAGWGDFDNDGYLDLYVVNSGTDPAGKGPNYLYRNNRNGTFRMWPQRLGFRPSLSLAAAGLRGAITIMTALSISSRTTAKTTRSTMEPAAVPFSQRGECESLARDPVESAR